MTQQESVTREREAFEKWFTSDQGSVDSLKFTLGSYDRERIQDMWEAWQARASLQGGEVNRCKCRLAGTVWAHDVCLRECPGFSEYLDSGDCYYCMHDKSCHARKEG